MRFRFERVIVVVAMVLLVSAISISVDAKVKKRARNTKQTTQVSLNTYSQTLVNMAEGGDAEAQFALGNCYENGKGVAKDEQKALYWYNKAADQGNARGQAFAALMYLNGKGTEVDLQKGFQLAKASADQDNAQGQYVLGTCYLYGEGTDRNVKIAWDWLTKASNKGHKYAKKTLEDILSDEDLSFEATYDYKDWDTEAKAWTKAKSLNTAIAYGKYLELYPDGAHADEVNELYIDSTVDKTSKGEYNELLPTTYSNNSLATESLDEITNTTDYKIEVLYSGPNKKRIIIVAGDTKTIRLENGTYEIVARVLNANVTNCYGIRDYYGIHHTTKYYIVTTYRH